MTRKPTPPTPDESPRPSAPSPVPAANPRQSQDQRWQRTVRFNWDNGGRRGGNNGGRK